MRILGRIVGVHSTKQSVGIKVGGFCPRHLISSQKNIEKYKNIIYNSNCKRVMLMRKRGDGYHEI